MKAYDKAKGAVAIRKLRMAVPAIIVATAFLFTFVVSPQVAGQQVYAADYEQWEDCDWDGYDDHTGVAVPWPGFDGTRGDTPSGPSPNSQTGKKKAEEEKAAKEKAAKEKAAKEKAAKQKAAKAKAAKEKAAKKKAEKEKAAKEAAEKAKAAEDDKKAEEEKDSAKDAKGAAIKKTTRAAVEATTQEAVQPSDEIEAAPEPDTEQDELAAAIVQQKGEIKVTESEGAALHAGSDIVINGSGFYWDVDELDIEIHSAPTLLGKVATDSIGDFELSVTIPEDFEAGTHNIVVLYKGEEVTRSEVSVGAPPANSFLSALSVGFTTENGELPAGILILAALLVLGVIALLVNAVRRRGTGQSKSVTGVSTVYNEANYTATYGK